MSSSLPFRFSCTDSLSWTANQSDFFCRGAEGVGTAEKDTTVRDTPIWVGRQDAHRRPDIYRRPKSARCVRALSRNVKTNMDAPKKGFLDIIFRLELINEKHRSSYCVESLYWIFITVYCEWWSDLIGLVLLTNIFAYVRDAEWTLSWRIVHAPLVGHKRKSLFQM